MFGPLIGTEFLRGLRWFRIAVVVVVAIIVACGVGLAILGWPLATPIDGQAP